MIAGLRHKEELAVPRNCFAAIPCFTCGETNFFRTHPIPIDLAPLVKVAKVSPKIQTQEKNTRI
jgi:hypothetical protein